MSTGEENMKHRSKQRHLFKVEELINRLQSLEKGLP